MENLIIRRLENRRKYMNDIRKALDGKTCSELEEEIFKLTQLQSLLFLTRYGISETGFTKDARRALYRN